MAGHGEGVDLLLHALLQDLADPFVGVVPDEVVAVLALVDAVQCLGHAVDGIAGGVGRNVPLLPLEAHQLVLPLQVLLQLVPAEGRAGLLLDEFPHLADLVGAVLLHQGIVKLHGLGHGKQGLVQKPILDGRAGHGAVAGLVGGDDEGGVVRHIVQHEQSRLGLAHGAGVAGQTDGLDSVDVVEHRVVVHVTGDEIGDHLQGDVLVLAPPGVENTAPHRLLVGDGVLPRLVVFAAVEVGVGPEHGHELLDGDAGHGAVMPGGGPQRLAPQSLQAAVKPVEHGQIGLAHPAVAPQALGENNGAAEFHDVHNHLAVVIEPDVVEIVERVLHAPPLPVFIEAGLGQIQVAQPPLAVGLAVPEIPGDLLPIGFFQLFPINFLHFFPPSWIFLISILSIKAWNRVRSWPDAELTYSFSMEQVGMP